MAPGLGSRRRPAASGVPQTKHRQGTWIDTTHVICHGIPVEPSSKHEVDIQMDFLQLGASQVRGSRRGDGLTSQP